MLLDLFPELIRGGPELSTELLHLIKNSLRNVLGMFEALQFLRFWVYRKISLDFFIELIRGGGDQNSQQNFWSWKNHPFEIFWVFLKYCSFLDFVVIEKCLPLCLWNFLGMFKVLQFLGFWVCRKMLSEFVVELIPGGPELSTELLHLTKNSLRHFLGMFKAQKLLGFWVYRKI